MCFILILISLLWTKKNSQYFREQNILTDYGLCVCLSGFVPRQKKVPEFLKGPSLEWDFSTIYYYTAMTNNNTHVVEVVGVSKFIVSWRP